MPTNIPAFQKISTDDIAMAVAASNRIILEALYRLGASREVVEADYRAKVDQMIRQYEAIDAANLLRMMSGTVQPRAVAKPSPSE